jgi:hypothetical protein
MEGLLLGGELGSSLGLPDGASGVFVGLSGGIVVGPLVAPNSVGSILTVGNPEGLMLRLDDGHEVGFADSITVGSEPASNVGLELPVVVGALLPSTVGAELPVLVGFPLDETVGRLDDSIVGFVLEAKVGPPLEATVGRSLEATVGISLARTVGEALEAIVGRSETAEVGKLVGPFNATVVGLTVAPNSVGSILTVGKSVGAFEGRNVGLDVVRSVGALDGAGVGLEVGLSVTEGKTVGFVLETKVGPSEAAVVGKLVGPFDGLPLVEIDGLAESIRLLLSFTAGLIDGAEDAVLLGCEETEGESDGRSPNQISSRNSSGPIVSPSLSRVPPKTIVLFPPG